MIVDCAAYTQGRRVPEVRTIQDAYAASRRPGTFVWIGLYEPTEEEFETVRKEFNLHELAVEDAIEAHQRPKLELYDDTMFVVLKTARYDDASESVELGEILLFIGSTFAVVVRHGKASSLSEVRRGVESDPELLANGPGTVLHAIMDRVVDDYQPVIDGLGYDIEEIEKQVFSEEGGGNPVERIYFLKREVLEFSQAAAPLLDPLDRLARARFGQTGPELSEYFRDVHDHLTRVVEELHGFRDMLTGILEANLTQVSVRQNEDMRKISAWVAIAAVPTALASIYGMNFERIPGLRVWWGFPVVLAVMAASCVLLFRLFRKSGWL